MGVMETRAYRSTYLLGKGWARFAPGWYRVNFGLVLYYN